MKHTIIIVTCLLAAMSAVGLAVLEPPIPKEADVYLYDDQNLNGEFDDGESLAHMYLHEVGTAHRTIDVHFTISHGGDNCALEWVFRRDGLGFSGVKPSVWRQIFHSGPMSASENHCEMDWSFWPMNINWRGLLIKAEAGTLTDSDFEGDHEIDYAEPGDIWKILDT